MAPERDSRRAGSRAPELPFVGRETQLGALVAAVEAAELGESVLAFVAGEAGIGKTRLVNEVAARVSARVLWATCWDGAGAPAYWPWSQLLRALTDQGGEGFVPPGDQGSEQISDLLGAAPASAEVSTGARFQLFDTVAGVFAKASRQRPLLLVLEDLHWADEASVRLLEFLDNDRRARQLAIVGTYRDSDLDPAHPLARRLDALVRHGLHLSLGGLGKRDIAALVGSLSVPDIDLPSVIPLLHRKSGGNPFFLRELVRLLGADGSRDSLRLDVADTVPAGVRAVVARRLMRLSPSTQEVLAAASVVGADFDMSVLIPVTGRSTGELLTALDEAAAAALVIRQGDGVTFSFIHALVREVLYQGLGLAARTAAHRKIADVVEERHGDARLPELAHHLLQGALGVADDRTLDCVVRAAERSFALLAYEEAATWYGRALELLRATRAGHLGEGDLLLRCGEARLSAGELPAAREAYQQAAVLARNNGDAEQLARAALGLGAGLGGFEVQLLDPAQVELLEEALGALDPAPSRLRARVLARLSVALSFMDDEARRRSLSEQAVAMARQVADLSALGYALAGHCDAIAGPEHCETRLTTATEVVRLARETGDHQLELLGRRLRLLALLEIGDVAAADIEIERFAQVADRLRQPLYRWYVPLWRGMRALMRRDIDEAARQCAVAEEIGALAHSDNARMLTFTQSWVRQRYQGKFSAAGEALTGLLGGDQGGPGVTAVGWPYPAVAATQLGERDRARALLEQWLAAGLERRPRDSEWLPESAQLAEAAVVVHAHAVAEVLYAQLKPYAHRFCVEGIGAACTGSVAWYLAILARYLGHRKDADAYAEQARAAHRRIGLVGDPPPLARPVTAAARSTPERSAALVWEGAAWAASYAGTTRRLRDSKGLRDLAVLLARPGQEVHCLELMGGANVGSEAGPALDEQARRAYQRRIRDLQQDIDEAQTANDPIRAQRAEAELDALVQQLSEAFGLSGRSRSTGSAAERARSAVGWRIRATLRHVTEVHPELGRHLHNAVRTGTWCSYRPETAVAWEIDDGQGRRA
ncbi:MAG: ATP-binding protein [Pseudonocardiaceae bacterium]